MSVCVSVYKTSYNIVPNKLDLVKIILPNNLGLTLINDA